MALAVNKKTYVIIFQKCPGCQENKYQFTIDNHIIEQRMSYTYIGITTTASGSFVRVSEYTKRKRVLNAIKKNAL